MTTTHEQLNDLREIRSLMERSSRFIGLSGLSGIAAGFCALTGATITYIYLDARPFQYDHPSRLYYDHALDASKWGFHYTQFFILVASLIIGLSFSAQAQNTSKNAFGLRLGDNDGFGGELSYQRKLS